MAPVVVALCYGSALAAGLLVLWYFGPKRWYWHLLSIALALGIGSVPMTNAWNAPERTLMVGWFFVFLIVWGAAAPLFAFTDSFGMHLRHHH